MSSFKSICSLSSTVKARLELNENVVYLRGLNKSERDEAPVSLLRGRLQVVVRSNVEHVEKVQIKLIGSSIDVVYTKSLGSRSLRESEKKTIIEDSYDFEVNHADFVRGAYSFPFQFILEPDLPETIFTCLGSRQYRVEAKILFKHNTELITLKPVRILRCPIEGSLLFSQCIRANGTWCDYMKYEISVCSKYIVLGEDFKICFKLWPASEMKKCSIKSISVYFVQKLQCDQRSDYLFDGETFEFTNKFLLKQLKPERASRDEINYDTVWTIKIPKSLPFNIHPYLTNNQPASEYEAPKGLRISHSIRMILTVEPVEYVQRTTSNESEAVEASSTTTPSSSMNPVKVDTSEFSNSTASTVARASQGTIPLPVLKSDVLFKAPIRILFPSALKQPTPPTYEEAILTTTNNRNKTIFNPLKLFKRLTRNELYFPPPYTC